MIGIQATIEGDKEMSVMLGLAADGMKDFSQPLRDIGTQLLKTFDMNFDSEGATVGAPWVPRTSGGDWPLLVKTGAMRSSFDAKASTHEVVLTNWAPYFKYHQSNKPRKKLPRRVMMKLTEDSRREIIKTFQMFVINKARGRH